MYRGFLFATGTLCVIAAMSLFRLHLIESQYAAVALGTIEPIAQITDTTTEVEVSASPVVFPTPSEKEEVAEPEAALEETVTAPQKTILVPKLSDVEALNSRARAATVNIACAAPGSDNVASGSGTIIDPRGVILTNAHVAQYLLLQESGAVSVSCVIRTGSPATSRYSAEVLYISSQWVSAHADEIRQESAKGTGEHDYALLRITGSTSGQPLPSSFSYITPDTRAEAQVPTQQVLVSSYPAGFLGSVSARFDLSLVTTIASLQELFTFSGEQAADLVSLGGVISAQSGSSGGGVIDGSGNLIGVIATADLNGATAERDLHAITLYHINQSILGETGKTLLGYLSGNLGQIRADFAANLQPDLNEAYIEALMNN